MTSRDSFPDELFLLKGAGQLVRQKERSEFLVSDSATEV